MAPTRGKSRKSPARSSSGGSLLGGWLGTVVLAIPPLLIGLLGGYAWRSFAPLPLPMESKLVADKTSVDVDIATLDAIRSERDSLKRRLETLEADRAKAERALGDLRIQDVLQSRAE